MRYIVSLNNMNSTYIMAYLSPKQYWK